jgi:hypothetical protein
MRGNVNNPGTVLAKQCITSVSNALCSSPFRVLSAGCRPSRFTWIESCLSENNGLLGNRDPIGSAALVTAVISSKALPA